jgi:hypothetical protein
MPTETKTIRFDLTDGVKAVVEECLAPYRECIDALEQKIDSLRQEVDALKRGSAAGR